MGIHIKHGPGISPTYRTWTAMLARAHHGCAACSHNYIGRGITVCARWLVFENFLADMGEKPAGKSIDRINNNGNYEPGNCRWATVLEQSYNRRTNHMVTAFGRTQALKAWAIENGSVWPETIAKRIGRGWTPEHAVSAPRYSLRAKVLR